MDSSCSFSSSARLGLWGEGQGRSGMWQESPSAIGLDPKLASGRIY